MSEPVKIAPDHIVSIAYKLRIEDGRLADETKAGEPLVYLHGHGHMMPGLERALEGKVSGDSGRFRIPPEDAYGPHDPSRIFTEAPDRFGFPVEVGMVLQAQAGEGRTFPIQVVAVEPDGITLDSNHPLAGKTLDFEVDVLSVRAATPEELRMARSGGEGCSPHQCGSCGMGCEEE